jgi:hypothetical protein
LPQLWQAGFRPAPPVWASCALSLAAALRISGDSSRGGLPFEAGYAVFDGHQALVEGGYVFQGLTRSHV